MNLPEPIVTSYETADLSTATVFTVVISRV